MSLSSYAPPDALYLWVVLVKGRITFQKADSRPKDRAPDRPQGVVLKHYDIAPEDNDMTLDQLTAKYHPMQSAPLPRIVSQIPEPKVEGPNRQDISEALGIHIAPLVSVKEGK